MTDLKVFKSTEFGELGVMTVNGKEYFPATQCAKLLGHKNPQEAIRLKCKGVRKILTPTVGGSQEVNYIPEGDLYRLIVSSKLPAAEKFESWVFDEVLPSIRQTGGYGQNIDLEKNNLTDCGGCGGGNYEAYGAGTFQCSLCAENEEGKAAHLQSADENGTPAARCQEAGRRYDSFGRIFLSADCKLHC
ncbi:MAG: Bro-N domain-containing protein [Ruminococcus sp.]|nr:MAG: Bro-N domain-containing protein [Ruminococcus sp.]